jgi:hypothetical protein
MESCRAQSGANANLITSSSDNSRFSWTFVWQSLGDAEYTNENYISPAADKARHCVWLLFDQRQTEGRTIRNYAAIVTVARWQVYVRIRIDVDIKLDCMFRRP